jgi:predicted anti-sigma-YlaC factor YlaD
MMTSCKEASRLASDALNRRLTLRERIALRTHLLICAACRRFEQQIAFLHDAASRMGAAEAGTSVTLSPAARERITARVRQGKTSPRRSPRGK